MQQGRFCVLTMPRSGSTFLMSLLNSHPHVNAFEELFLDRPSGERLAWVAEGSPERFFYFRRSSMWPRPVSVFLYLRFIHKFDMASAAVGFKLMLSHARSLPELLLALALNGYKIIYLTRSNLFERCVSSILSKSSGIPHSQESVSTSSIRVDPTRLVHDMQRMSRKLDFTNWMIRLFPFSIHKLEYDDLSADPAGECNRIFKFLNVDPDVDVSSKLKKRVNVPYSTLIANYGEVCDALTRAGMDSYLQQDLPSVGSGTVPNLDKVLTRNSAARCDFREISTGD